MKPIEEKARKDAVENWDENILVSAGAGSGKTHTLVERVYSKAKAVADTDPDFVLGLLIVTFTKKAAGEMKERIRNKFLEDPITAKLAEKVESAEITTFDAFALSIVQKYHYELGLLENPTIGPESLFSLKEAQEMDRLINERFEDALNGKNDRFKGVIDAYGSDAYDFVFKGVDVLLGAADKEVDPVDYLRNLPDRMFGPKAVKDYETKIISYIDSAYAEMMRLGNEIATEDSLLDVYLENFRLPHDATSEQRLAVIKNADLSKKRLGDDPETVRTKKAFMDYRKKIKSFLGSISTIAEGVESYQKGEPFIRETTEIALGVIASLKALKDSASVYSFSDIFRMASSLLDKDPEVLEEVKGQFHHIMVDEYQDTNDLQEAFITKIGNGHNIFRVGDIKQSIYRFRNANPDLFGAKYEEYGKGNDGKLLTFSTNFRSRKNVIDGINAIFDEIMTKKLGGAEYKEGHELEYSEKKFKESESLSDYGLETIVYQPPEKDSKSVGEATSIAKDIIKRVKDPSFLVLDSDTKLPRRAQYQDFCILMPTKSNFGIFQTVFSEAHLPVESVDLTPKAEKLVRVALSQLSKLAVAIVDGNEKKAKLMFLGLARSFLFQMDSNTVHELLVSGEYKNAEPYKTVAKNANWLLKANADDALEFLTGVFDFLGKLPRIGDIKANYERISDLISELSVYPKFGYCLRDFAENYDLFDKMKIKEDIASSQSEGGSVRLMTMHASKGLQFKVVYLAGLSGHPNGGDAKGPVLASRTLGVSFPDLTTGGDTLHKKFIKEEVYQAIFSEETRLLYVAATRAEEKLIFLMPNEFERSDDLSIVTPRLEYLLRSGKLLENSNADPIPFEPFEESAAIDGCETEEVVFGYVDPSLLEKKVIESKHASKGMVEPVDPAKLIYGTKMHRYLELVDFKTKDVSFITDDKDRKHIENVLKLPIFDHVSSAKAYKEYAFEDEQTGQTNIIDLLLVYEDHAEIIDYKSSDIDDPDYEDQLAVYEAYVKAHFTEKVNKYLLSIRELRVKEVI